MKENYEQFKSYMQCMNDEGSIWLKTDFDLLNLASIKVGMTLKLKTQRNSESSYGAIIISLSYNNEPDYYNNGPKLQ